MLALIMLAIWLSDSGALAKPPVCVWQPPTDNTFTSCYVNYEFVASLASTVGRTGSPSAKRTIADAVGVAACFPHDANTAAGRASCAAATEHQCYIDTPDGLSLQCYTNAFNHASVHVVCPNTAYYDTVYCSSLPKSKCVASPVCSYSLLPEYGPSAGQVEATEAWYKNYTGSDDTFLGQYSCYSKAELNAATNKETGAWDPAADISYLNEAIDSTDAAKYFSSKGRGDCPYAKHAFVHAKKTRICSAFNVLDIKAAGQFAILSSDHVADIKATVMAIAAGCVLVPSNKIPYNKAFHNISAEWLTAQIDPVVEGELAFDAATDCELYKAWVACSGQDRQYNQVACEETKV